tara:strand:- start:1104 stop:1340 length:237 start_codon:yes stop_codon:yes gene_type:complete
MNSILKNTLLVGGGIAAGIITGILTAPKSGKETREDIMNKIQELQSKISSLTGEARQALEAKIQDLKKSLSEVESELS